MFEWGRPPKKPDNPSRATRAFQGKTVDWVQESTGREWKFHFTDGSHAIVSLFQAGHAGAAMHLQGIGL